MRKLIAIVWGVLLVCSLVVFGQDVSEGANTRVVIGRSSPRPSVTPRPDQFAVGLPQPSAAPVCASGKATLFSDPTGRCVYACVNGNVMVIKNVGAACVFPTATATPTPTATPTATA